MRPRPVLLSLPAIPFLALPLAAAETCLPYPFDAAPPEMREVLDMAAPALQRFPYYPASMASAGPSSASTTNPSARADTSTWTAIASRSARA